MSISVLNNPSIDSSYGQGIIHTTTGTLDFSTQNNLFYDPFLKPVWDTMLYKNYEQYLLTYIFDYIGAAKETAYETVNWAEIGLIRKQQPVLSASLSTIYAEVTINSTERYYIVGDVIKTQTGRYGYVTEIVSTSPQVIKLESMNGENWEAGDFDEGSVLFHAYNFFEKCYTLPQGRNYFPEKKSASMMWIADNNKYCLDTGSQPIWLEYNGKNYWVDQNQEFMYKAHAKNIENAIVLGQSSTVSTGAVSQPGIVTQVLDEGNVVSTSGAADEDDFIDFSVQLIKNGVQAKGEYLVLCGANYLASATKAMKNYRTYEYANSALVKTDTEFKLKLNSYQYNDTIFHFFNYPLFNEMPENTSGINFQKGGLFLNIGQGMKSRGIEVYYRVNNLGRKEYMLKSMKYGHGVDKIRMDDDRCFSEAVSTQVLVKMTMLNTHGFMYEA